MEKEVKLDLICVRCKPPLHPDNCFTLHRTLKHYSLMNTSIKMDYICTKVRRYINVCVECKFWHVRKTASNWGLKEQHVNSKVIQQQLQKCILSTFVLCNKLWISSKIFSPSPCWSTPDMSLICCCCCRAWRWSRIRT